MGRESMESKSMSHSNIEASTISVCISGISFSRGERVMLTRGDLAIKA